MKYLAVLAATGTLAAAAFAGTANASVAQQSSAAFSTSSAQKQASSVSVHHSSSQTTKVSTRATTQFGRRWYGWDLNLNRGETLNLAAGSAGAAAIATLIPDPTASKIVAASLGVYAAYASWVYARGGCLRFRIMFSRVILPDHYFGGYCS
jgi:hypothetical protein